MHYHRIINIVKKDVVCKMKNLGEDKVRVIKISKEALFEFIYENFINDQDIYFDVDPMSVTDAFDINFERGEFIFCVYNSEEERAIQLPEKIDFQQLMKNIPDTTTTMYTDNRYKEFTKSELIRLSKKPE